MKKVLVIEDDRAYQRIVANTLAGSDYEVVRAEDACQGYQFALDHDPSVIILDLKLPAGDGLTILKRMRNNAATRKIPIIVLTSIQDEEYKSQVVNEGVDAFLEKPVEEKKLLSTIEDVLKKSENPALT